MDFGRIYRCLYAFFYAILGLMLVSGQAQARPVLEDVTVAHKGDHTEVVLRFSALPAYAYAPAAQPFRLVITADAIGKDSRIEGRGGTVSEVRVAAQDDRCRIEIVLISPGDFEVVARGREVVAQFRAGGVGYEENRFPVPDFSQSSIRDIRDMTVRRIAVDAGHGGHDGGATHHGIKEKDVVLAIAQHVVALINADGRAHAFLTRQGDYYLNLRDRPLVAHQYGADLFVSIHANAVETGAAHGTEIYYCSEQATSEMAARLAADENRAGESDEKRHLTPTAVDVEDILLRFERRLYQEDSRQIAQEMLSRMSSDLGTRKRLVQGANFAVLRHARMPAVLVEVGFVSNPEEARRLGDPAFQKEAAASVFRSLARLLPEGERR